MSPRFSLQYCDENDRSDIVDFLAASDLAVTDVRIAERSSSQDATVEHGSSAAGQARIKGNTDGAEVDVFLRHRPDSGEAAEIDISEESDGTRKMFALAAPWIDSLTRGNVIVMDELHDTICTRNWSGSWWASSMTRQQVAVERS